MRFARGAVRNPHSTTGCPDGLLRCASLLLRLVRQFQSFPRAICRGASFRKEAQFSFGHNEFRSATIQADNQFREHPSNGFVNVLQSGAVEVHFPDELVLVN